MESAPIPLWRAAATIPCTYSIPPSLRTSETCSCSSKGVCLARRRKPERARIMATTIATMTANSKRFTTTPPALRSCLPEHFATRWLVIPTFSQRCKEVRRSARCIPCDPRSRSGDDNRRPLSPATSNRPGAADDVAKRTGGSTPRFRQNRLAAVLHCLSPGARPCASGGLPPGMPWPPASRPAGTLPLRGGVIV